MQTSRRDRTIQEARHDTYRARGKPREATSCPQCGAAFHKGRWTWRTKQASAHEAVCPACSRINENYPAGLVTLTGGFLATHREEIMGLVRNEEAQAKAEHPLSRIIRIEPEGAAVVVSTTDTHLAQRIGEALRHAYQGTLTIHYAKDATLARVLWTREERPGSSTKGGRR